MPIPSNAKKFAIKAFRKPSITGYNRLEPSPRSADFERSLQAEIRDPLWMLTRQWQFGEFQGEDAASPVTAQILADHVAINRVHFPGNKQFSYDPSIPLETKVERESVPASLFHAVQLGRHFLKLMRANGLEGHLGLLIAKFPFSYAIDPNDTEGLQLKRAVEGKLFDGRSVENAIRTISGPGNDLGVWLASQAVSLGDLTKFQTIADAFIAWINRSFSQPDSAADSAWLPSQLEYQFKVSAQENGRDLLTLNAEQYQEGHLDWYSFDLTQIANIKGTESAQVSQSLTSFIPAPISFKGMPYSRYWMMGDSQVDFGKIDTSATGLLHLLLAEFGLVYSNDWFMLPYPLKTNTACEIQGMVLTDVFGQHILIRPAGRGSESNWHRWSMFRQTDRTGGAANHNLFYLAPAITKALEGEPLEQVNFLRDEMANLVWGVETRVPSQAGIGVSGNEIARKKDEPAPFAPVGEAKIRYLLGTTVPENWIPFIPVHMNGSDTEIQLQRAKMPNSKGPMGRLLQEVPAPYYIQEEEVPRSGVIVERSWQRARWLRGASYLWIGRYKEAGKGEGWSNLKFDQLEDIPEKSE
ncbi:MAG: hypothetical protein IPN95_16370 [Bacteroidetes bacterium]|nr:hypothetical protein [Bacteroidota bacterium]